MTYPRMFAVCALLFSFRAWQRFIHMELWAEDGALYLAQALEHGLRSLTFTYGGFYHLVPRALVLLWLRALPLEWFAAAINISATLIFAAVAAMPIRRQYGWIIASDRVRCCLCLVFCLTPGLNEMVGNYCNLPWVFCFTVAFLGLKDPSAAISAGEALLAILAIASMGQALFLVPLFAWRLMESIQERRSRAHIFGNALLLALLAVSIGVLWLVRSSAAAGPQQPLSDLTRVFVKTTRDAVLFLPWLGDRLTIAVSGMPTAWARALIATGTCALFCTAAARSRRNKAAQAGLLLLGGIALWPAVSWWARPGNFAVFAIPLNDAFTKMRYAFPTVFAAYLVWVLWIDFSKLHSAWKNSLYALLLLMNVGFGGSRFWIKQYGPERRWEQFAPRLKQARETGCPNPVAGSIYPDGWEVHYENGRRCDER